MNKPRREGRDADGDILGTLRRRRAVLHPLARLDDDRLPGLHVELLILQLHMQAQKS